MLFLFYSEYLISGWTQSPVRQEALYFAVYGYYAMCKLLIYCLDSPYKSTFILMYVLSYTNSRILPFQQYRRVGRFDLFRGKWRTLCGKPRKWTSTPTNYHQYAPLNRFARLVEACYPFDRDGALCAIVGLIQCYTRPWQSLVCHRWSRPVLNSPLAELCVPSLVSSSVTLAPGRALCAINGLIQC